MGLISPGLDVQLYDRVNRYVYFFDTAFDTISDTACFTVNDRILLCDANGVPRSDPTMQQVEISNIDVANGRVTIDNDFRDAGMLVIYPEPHDVLIGVQYDFADNGEPDKFHFLAGIDGEVGVAGDDGYVYSVPAEGGG